MTFQAYFLTTTLDISGTYISYVQDRWHKWKYYNTGQLGDISGTFPMHRKVGVSDICPVATQDRQNTSCENLGYVYVGNISWHFLHVAYTSKMHHVYNIKYTQIEVNIATYSIHGLRSVKITFLLKYNTLLYWSHFNVQGPFTYTESWDKFQL